MMTPAGIDVWAPPQATLNLELLDSAGLPAGCWHCGPCRVHTSLAVLSLIRGAGVSTQLSAPPACKALVDAVCPMDLEGSLQITITPTGTRWGASPLTP